VIVRYFAAARAAAGVGEEPVEAGTLAEALDAVRAAHGPRLGEVLDRCSFLVDGNPVGLRDPADVPLGPESVADCLPPFAGG
jgi:molybdopterin converting factor small subunit